MIIIYIHPRPSFERGVSAAPMLKIFSTAPRFSLVLSFVADKRKYKRAEHACEMKTDCRLKK